MIDETAFKEAMRLFASGVTVLTWQAPAQTKLEGVTVSAFASLSLNPLLVLFCIDQKSYAYQQLIHQDYLTINILSSTQKDIAYQFAGPNRDALDDEINYKNSEKQPMLSNAQAALLVKITNHIAQGDHDIFIAEVQEADLYPERAPLLYHNSKIFA